MQFAVQAPTFWPSAEKENALWKPPVQNQKRKEAFSELLSALNFPSASQSKAKNYQFLLDQIRTSEPTIETVTPAQKPKHRTAKPVRPLAQLTSIPAIRIR